MDRCGGDSVASMRGRTQRFLTRRVENGAETRVPDDLIVEEPMTIRLDEQDIATTMRTPGHDFELAVGFAYTDGQIPTGSVNTIRYCATGSAVESEFNVVSVESDGRAMPRPRMGNISSSCGLCGSDAIDELVDRISPLTSPVHMPTEVMFEVLGAVQGQQKLFSTTGAVHSAAAFDQAGKVLVLREDIGRHNAVDKVVGRLYLDGRVPAQNLGLFVSGRASFEMVQKAWAAGFGSLLAVSAPSALAVEAARTAGLQLAGFAREGRLNLYAPEAVRNDTQSADAS